MSGYLVLQVGPKATGIGVLGEYVASLTRGPWSQGCVEFVAREDRAQAYALSLRGQLEAAVVPMHPWADLQVVERGTAETTERKTT